MSTFKTVVNSVFLVMFALFEILAILASIGHVLVSDWDSFIITAIMAAFGHAMVKVFKSNIDKG